MLTSRDREMKTQKNENLLVRSERARTRRRSLAPAVFMAQQGFELVLQLKGSCLHLRETPRHHWLVCSSPPLYPYVIWGFLYNFPSMKSLSSSQYLWWELIADREVGSFQLSALSKLHLEVSELCHNWTSSLFCSSALPDTVTSGEANSIHFSLPFSPPSSGCLL